jgi:hypothetical protein
MAHGEPGETATDDGDAGGLLAGAAVWGHCWVCVRVGRYGTLPLW